MKILQLIDTLEAGGAERVAVNFANGLLNQVEASFLCATRAEGLLKDSLKMEVGYLFLNKKSTLDFKAIKKLNRYVKKNQISIIHAHSSSYFLASIIKFLNPKLKLFWHDHYGKSEFLEARPKAVLKLCSHFFNHVFSVNSKLEAWTKEKLKVKSVAYLPNFAVKTSVKLTTELNGQKGKRIVCLANLRHQKDHLNLLNGFKQVIKVHKNWTLHLVGQDFKDDYSNSIFTFINENKLEQSVFLYGSCSDTSAILEQCDIGVLASSSEGLPLALLEYGLAKLPVVVTEVGDCSLVVTNKIEGLLIPPTNTIELTNAILNIIDNLENSIQLGENLYKKVQDEFSENSTIKKVLKTYKQIFNEE